MAAALQFFNKAGKVIGFFTYGMSNGGQAAAIVRRFRGLRPAVSGGSVRVLAMVIVAALLLRVPRPITSDPKPAHRSLAVTTPTATSDSSQARLRRIVKLVLSRTKRRRRPLRARGHQQQIVTAGFRRDEVSRRDHLFDTSCNNATSSDGIFRHGFRRAPLFGFSARFVQTL
ncbi:MAG: hypothetical protein ACREC9_11215 [Methylocella sp.]